MAKAAIRVSISSAQVQKALRDIASYTASKQQAIREAIALSALAIQAEAKTTAPVDTGRLRSSIDATYAANGYGATVGTEVEYAAKVEFGLAGQRAQPYLFPAAEKERPRFIANIKRILSQ